MWSVLFLCFSKYASHTKAEKSNVLTGFDRGGDILVQDRALTVNNSTDFFKSLCQSVWKTMWMCFDTSTVKLHAKTPISKMDYHNNINLYAWEHIFFSSLKT